MKVSPLFLLGALTLVGCEAPTVEETKNSFRVMVMGGSLEKDALLDPQGEEPTGAHQLTGEPKPIPAPAKPAYFEDQPELRDVASAKAFVFESSWHSEPLWLYPDGSYATKDPQRIRGTWKQVHKILTLSPEHGGRLVFSVDAKGNFLPEDGGITRLRKVLH